MDETTTRLNWKNVSTAESHANCVACGAGGSWAELLHTDLGPGRGWVGACSWECASEFESSNRETVSTALKAIERARRDYWASPERSWNRPSD
jgi:hypothetical protein